MRTDPEPDCLRKAALILSTRARRKTFTLRVIIRVLERTADRIERTPPGDT